MSFPDMNKEDITWIICCIACDTKLLDELLYLNTFDGKIVYLCEISKYNIIGIIQGYEEIINIGQFSPLCGFYSRTKPI